MKVSVIAPVLNECPWIGYSILSALPYVNDFWYALDTASGDGTRELLAHIHKHYAKGKLNVLEIPTFKPSDMKAYNDAFNLCIGHAEGDAVWFLHPDMIVTKWTDLQEGPLAWWTHVKSYAGDFKTLISKGRADCWKNIHAKQFGLHYFGGYGSQNEDFYYREITGNSYRHFGTDFRHYPYEVADSGISVSHFCELKPYARRLEKMKLCLKTQHPNFMDEAIEEMAEQHPRVTLEASSAQFGIFEFQKVEEKIPDVIETYRNEFEAFCKEPLHV